MALDLAFQVLHPRYYQLLALRQIAQGRCHLLNTIQVKCLGQR